ncbi:unnamed protein product [Sordaria macrospora k-hell]|uniref:WGS project CABT00000000 data, contig 2.3 n=2 Tax=Sordaria macrospora TaxID=5147 RepID=F7VPH0_SORMK|nr:uncharacterized protein SMAC_02405 [Sordaria macrospora k-hell]KAH7626968.1 hypothetical protein B0T09DRAFT_37220 [Sordaria sp. MPI-SDFR-AT-0083]CCC07398.1 unnamed protein product [Sordaria macrospora k-hell]
MHEHEHQHDDEHQYPVPDRTDPNPESALEYEDPKMLPTIKGTGYLVLNGLRALTLIGLAMTMTSSWIMIVLSGLGGRFDFFDSASHFFVFAVAIFLFISELNIRSFRAFFARNWPVLCPSHSLVWLGLAMVVMGCAIMGDLVKPAYSMDNLGLAMWRLVLATGILSLTFGVFNVVASLIFNTSEGEGKIRRRITARMIRSHGDQAKGIIEKQDPFPDYYSTSQGSYPEDLPPAVNNHYYPPVQEQEQPELDTTFKARAHRWTKAAFPKNFRKSGRFPVISDPIPSVGVVAPTPQMNSTDSKRSGDHANVDLERGDSFRSNRRNSGGRFPINTGSAGRNNSPPPQNDRSSPVSPNVQRPPTVLHPYYNGGRRSPSLYSDANMSRF